MATSKTDVEFDDRLVRLFWKLHRFPWLQHLVLLLIRLRDILSFPQFILLQKPIHKDVDEMEKCHFRTLYIRDPVTMFADNHTDPDFLSSLQLNTNINYYSFDEAIWAASRVSLHLSACILYFIVYYQLDQDNISPITVAEISFFSAVVGYCILQAWRNWNEPWDINNLMEKVPLKADCMVAMSCGTLSYLLVPILRTVTTNVDIETVHAVCAILFGTHLVTNYYGIVTYCVSKPISINSALFSMICLSSRLQTNEHCLALLSFGFLSFVCFPQFSRMLWEWMPGALILIAVVISAGFAISGWLALFITIVMLIVLILSPATYIYCIRYKQNIAGPWDEVKLDLHYDMEEIDRGFERRRKQPPMPQVSPETKKEQEDIQKMEARGIGLLL